MQGTGAARNSSGGARPRGILYVVAMPIGNPEDITMRALRVLAEADLIACEDTRRTGRLLAEHNIRTPMLSYFEHNEQRRSAELVERLRGGAKVALATDAGTPLISDPGFRLVRAAIEAEIAVIAVPGPSAAVAALSIAGLPVNRVAFEGFVPVRAEARSKMLRSLSGETRTMVFFEAARRLGASLGQMAATFGESRRAAVVRELTKTHEEVIRGTLGELARRFAAEQTRGEITLVIEGAAGRQAERESEAGGELSIRMLTAAGFGLKEASGVIARLRNRGSRAVYQEALRERRDRE